MKNINNHVERLNKKKVRIITFASFLYGFALSIISYIISFYFQVASGTDNIGIFFITSYIVILFSLLNFHKMVKKIGKSSAVLLFFAIKIVAALLIVLLSPSILGALILIIYIIFANLGWVGLDIMLESFSIDRMSGRIRGLFLTISNMGFILGPFLSLHLLDKFSFRGVFFLVLFMDIVIFLIAFLYLRGINHTYNRNLSIINLIKEVGKKKDILKIYHISFLLDFFYGTMIIFSPIYLSSLGIALKDIGIIFTVMLIPFVVLQYPIGNLADKKLGEKELIIAAVLILAISTSSIFFINSTSIFVWAGVLFITRIGAASLEILRDSYFYKKVDGTDVEMIDFFRTSKSVAYITVSIISLLVLSFLPLKSVFLILSVIIFIGLFSAVTLRDNGCEEDFNNN